MMQITVKKYFLLPALMVVILLCFCFAKNPVSDTAWIRINLLGYQPGSVKTAVWCSKENITCKTFQLVNAVTKKFVFAATAGKAFGAYGPFKQSYRLDFTKFTQPGRYYLQAGGAKSPEFTIGEAVYNGTADFCLRYMRQQRTGFNPFLKDSCHTHDGYVLYGKNADIPDSTHINVVGGWHDASDYLQYASTSANAAYHLLMAYRDFPQAFGDEKQANGLDGKNGEPDVLDEARWGVDWLLKMHPSPGIMFNQIADDRDHMGMRMPAEDSFYGKGFERPVYFINGEPQQRGKFMNHTTGTSSTAAKMAGVFSLGAKLFADKDSQYAAKLMGSASSALDFALIKPGVTQTVSVRSPYIYAEDNWVDDMELGFAAFYASMDYMMDKKMAETPDHYETLIKKYKDGAYSYALQEKITPWLGADTASHYQWYPFINLGHFELAKILDDKRKDTIISFYKAGIEKVKKKAGRNAFLRGIPFIWCSNNLTVSFAIQCYWYRQLTGDRQFAALEQANFDWLFGCNPWGTSMVYGLPTGGDTPADPHSAFTHIKNYPIDGGLVDGPVYGSIYKNLIGITLYEPDEYAQFQSDLVVYHDDYGDYSTNEPTMDGTASLVYLLAAKASEAKSKAPAVSSSAYYQENFPGKNAGSFTFSHGGIIRGDTTEKKIALVFTGDEFADGGNHIAKTLDVAGVKASFFFTGNFYRNRQCKKLIETLKAKGHYIGAHSDRHLLYCDWSNRDSLLINQRQFEKDVLDNYAEMKKFGINPQDAPYFLPAYEWYNTSVSNWTKKLGLQLINFTPGTFSNADYTTPAMKNYKSSEQILQSIKSFEGRSTSGLNGFILLLHVGTDPAREDKMYLQLPALIKWLQEKQYKLVTINELLKDH